MAYIMKRQAVTDRVFKVHLAYYVGGKYSPVCHDIRQPNFCQVVEGSMLEVTCAECKRVGEVAEGGRSKRKLTDPANRTLGACCVCKQPITTRQSYQRVGAERAHQNCWPPRRPA